MTHGSMSIQWHPSGEGGKVHLTTYGILAGRFASLGQVTVDLDAFREPTSLAEFARLVLTALYGGSYDL